MRRAQLLINKVKFNTNNLDSSRYTDARIREYFNDAQRQIHNIMFQSKQDSLLYPSEAFIDLVEDQEKYDLPSDIYARNAIQSVARKFNDDSSEPYYRPLDFLDESERRLSFGYALYGKKIIITPLPDQNLTDGIRVVYEKKLPLISHRIGKISSVSGSQINLSDYTTEEIEDFEDFFCTVDSDGNIIDEGVEITNYNTGTGVLDFSGTVTASSGEFVVLGKQASSHSLLPDETENLLIAFVERKIHAIDSSQAIKDSDYLTKEERQFIQSLFEKNNKDVFDPPINDDSYMAY
jgi:hypothetical protein